MINAEKANTLPFKVFQISKRMKRIQHVKLMEAKYIASICFNDLRCKQSANKSPTSHVQEHQANFSLLRFLCPFGEQSQAYNEQKCNSRATSMKQSSKPNKAFFPRYFAFVNLSRKLFLCSCANKQNLLTKSQSFKCPTVASRQNESMSNCRKASPAFRACLQIAGHVFWLLQQFHRCLDIPIRHFVTFVQNKAEYRTGTTLWLCRNTIPKTSQHFVPRTAVTCQSLHCSVLWTLRWPSQLLVIFSL